MVIAVNAPCGANTQLFSFIHARHGTDIDATTSWTQRIDPGPVIPSGHTSVQKIRERTRS